MDLVHLPDDLGPVGSQRRFIHRRRWGLLGRGLRRSAGTLDIVESPFDTLALGLLSAGLLLGIGLS